METFEYFIFVNCCDIIVLHSKIIGPRFELVKEALECWGVDGYSAFIVFQKSRINPQREESLRVLPESWKALDKMWPLEDVGEFYDKLDF